MWRAFISRARCLSLACGLSLIWLPTDIAAQMLDFPRPVNQASSFNEPFGLPTVQVTTGALRDRWLKLEEKMEAERLVIRTCEENRASCSSLAALQFLSIIDIGRSSGGRGRLGKINRAINLSIRPMSDPSITGEEDVWSCYSYTHDQDRGYREGRRAAVARGAGQVPGVVRGIRRARVRREDRARRQVGQARPADGRGARQPRGRAAGGILKPALRGRLCGTSRTRGSSRSTMRCPRVCAPRRTRALRCSSGTRSTHPCISSASRTICGRPAFDGAIGRLPWSARTASTGSGSAATRTMTVSWGEATAAAAWWRRGRRRTWRG